MRVLYRSILCITVLISAGRCLAAPSLTLLTAYYPPFAYEECGILKGSAVEIVKNAFDRMHQKVDIRLVPFPRAIQMLMHGNVDGIFPFAKTDDRKTFTLYPEETLLSAPSVLYVRSNSSILFNGDFSKIAKYTFGTQRNTDQGAAFTQARQQYLLRVDDSADQEQNIQKLLAGRFDIGVGPHQVVEQTARKLKEESLIKFLEPPISQGNVYIGFSKKKDLETTVRNYDLAMKKMHQDGSYDKVILSDFWEKTAACIPVLKPDTQ